jgi:quercetin dioxygenase-like cupin family protein
MQATTYGLWGTASSQKAQNTHFVFERGQPMLHIENAQVDSQPVDTIEGERNTGTFFVKPLMRGESMALLEIRVRAGVASCTHTHSHESLIYVVSGRIKTVVNDETFVLGPGDVCRHPPAVGHRVEALEDTLFVEVKSPSIEVRQIFGLAAASRAVP